MSPVISQANSQAVQPYLAGKITAQQAYTDIQAPLKTWMLKQTQADDLALFAGPGVKPASPSAMPMSAIVPAFALSEMRAAFIIGFVDIRAVPGNRPGGQLHPHVPRHDDAARPPSSRCLSSCLLFILVNGWALVVQSLITSFH